MDKIQTSFMIAILALLISIGVPAYDRTVGSVLEDELKDYYICSVNDNILEFKGGISSTGYTGYPYLESRAGYKRCGTTENKGIWVNLKEYGKMIGLDPYTLLEENEVKTDVPNPTEGKSWKCNHEGCIKIK